MPDYNDKIKELEGEIQKTQYNKATQHHIGLIKAKISILRKKAESRAKKTGGEGFAVRKSGDATACLIGFPSVGKSTLLNRLTNAESKTASYAFTTLTCIPGTMNYNSAKIQILDLPGIIKGASGGLGKGREVIAVVRSSDLAIIVADVFDTKQVDAIRKELYDSNIRLDETPPQVTIKQTDRGGIQVASLRKLTKIDAETVTAILKEYRINNGYVTIKEDISAERLIDALEGNRVFLPSLIVLNKSDLVSKEEAENAARLTNGIPLSAENKSNIEMLKETIYRKLRLMRIYLKEYGKKTDNEPLIVRQNSTIMDICRKLHKDFINKFKYAKVWGKSSKYPGERFRMEHVLQDQDIVEVKLR
ncbi:GTP-binding protein [Candidatus Woesearchaeota archaeon]|nr:GTP-binding protein [Candidatus Woesearchaeota archaeon]